MGRIEKLQEMLEIVETLKKMEEEKMKKEKEINKKFSDKCSMKVDIVTDKEKDGSCVEVVFEGVKGEPDLILLSVSAMSSILDYFDDKEDKARILAAVCSAVLVGEKAGIHRIKEEKEEEEEE